MHWVVSPVLHRYESEPGAAHNVVVCPGIGKRLPVMLQSGFAVTVIVLLLVLEHSFWVTVKAKVPAASTVMQRDVEPVLHK